MCLKQKKWAARVRNWVNFTRTKLVMVSQLHQSSSKTCGMFMFCIGHYQKWSKKVKQVDCWPGHGWFAVCCVSCFVTADQSGCPGWAVSTGKYTYNGHMNVWTVPWSSERSWPDQMNHGFLLHAGLGACGYYVAGCMWVSYLKKRWHQGALMYVNKACRQRQCDVLGNVLVVNLGSCHSCRCYFDM